MIHHRNSVWPAILGNAHEWYDFALYGYFSPIIAQLFFPSGNSAISLLLTFAVFATGFIFRPIGAMVFGHIGDRFGRKRALMITTMLMALPTTLMGLLPTYQQIGFWAPGILVLLRLLQGVAVSGELSGAAAYLIEHAKPNRRGLAGSLIMSSVYIGQLLGSLVGLWVSWWFGRVALHDYAWRIPFYLSLFFGIAIFILRIYSPETPQFTASKAAKEIHTAPLKITFQQHFYSVIRIVGFIAIAAVAGYILVGFLPTYLVNKMNFTLSQALLLNTVGMIVVMIGIPVVGSLSDTFGRKPFLIIGTVAFALLAYPIFWLFGQHSFGLALVGETIYALILSGINGVTTSVMAEMFPTNVRQTGSGIAFNISLAVFGGTAPLVCQMLIDLLQSHYAAADYLIFCALFSLPFIVSLPDRYPRSTSLMNIDWQMLANNIKRWGQDLGFQQVGICDTDLSVAEAQLQQWLDAEGYHGEMDYMTKHGTQRSRPEALVPDTVRVIMARIDYLPPNANIKKTLRDPKKGYIARYATGGDYHRFIRKKMQALAELIEAEVGPFGFRAFSDSAPVMEKPLAVKAGLGWQGKNTLVLNRRAGSYFFLGTLYTSLPLPIDEIVENDECGTCSACMKICPTQAIVAPYVLNASRCISYLTIELRTHIPEEFRVAIGNRIFGCDDCQLCCPWNRFAKTTDEKRFHPRHGLNDPQLIELFAWTEQEFLRYTEGSAIRRIGYECWVRNLAVALGNAPRDEQIITVLQEKSFVSEMVQEHIHWAFNKQISAKG